MPVQRQRKPGRIRARAMEIIGWTTRKAAEGVGSTVGSEIGKWLIQAVSGAVGGVVSGALARWLLWRDGP